MTSNLKSAVPPPISQMGSRRNTAMRTASSNKNDVFSAIGSLKRGKAANFYNPVQLL